MSIVASLREEHDRFFRYAQGWRRGEMSDEEFVDFVEDLVRVHFRDEEHILYPAMSGIVQQGELAAYEQAHREVAAELAQIRSSLANGGPAAARIARLADDIAAHAQSEEERLFREAERRLGPKTLADLQEKRHAYAVEA